VLKKHGKAAKILPPAGEPPLTQPEVHRTGSSKRFVSNGGYIETQKMPGMKGT